ncbi:hypothetical protein GW17_00031503 [Ensete ventricosum]|nr:hypothetical protein GW17_00031503 [Ensete ventricosum]
MSILGSQWSVTDVAVEVFLANKVFNLVSNAVTLLGVMSVLPIEMIVSSLVSPLRACHDQVGRPEKSLLSILEKNLYPTSRLAGRPSSRGGRGSRPHFRGVGLSLRVGSRKNQVFSDVGRVRLPLLRGQLDGQLEWCRLLRQLRDVHDDCSDHPG